MEAVAPHLQKVQALVVEHAFTIGIGLLVAVLIAGVAWYWMSRGSNKSDVLENQARVNEADMGNGQERPPFPSSAMAGEPPGPSAEVSEENMERERAALAQMAAAGQMPPVTE
jgi:hypothetical protein